MWWFSSGFRSLNISNLSAIGWQEFLHAGSKTKKRIKLNKKNDHIYDM